MLAAPLSITALKDIKPLSNKWRIEVKILNVWKTFNSTNGEQIEMILSDESGTKIAACVKREQVKKFKDILIQGSWKIITTFSMSQITAKFRVSELKLKMSFIYQTKVAPSEKISDDLFLSLARFDSILAHGELNANIMFDFLGQVVEAGECREKLLQNNKTSKMIEFQLRDHEDNRVTCTLWGKYALALDKAVHENTDGIIICLIRFTRLNIYGEKRTVTNTYDSTQLFFNPQIKEVAEFKNSLPDDGLQLVISDSIQNKSEIQAVFVDVEEYPMLTIGDLLYATEVGKCRTVCTICDIDTDWSWYYFSCKSHNRKCHIEETIKLEGKKTKPKPKFWCDLCNNYVKSVVAKLWLHLTIMDTTGHSKCLVFDSHVEKIAGTSAYQLLNETLVDPEDPSVLPPEIKSLIGKTFQFVLSIEKENIHSGYEYYKVTDVLSNTRTEQITIEDDEEFHAISGDQSSLMITDGSENVEADQISNSTPSSKRGSSSGDDSSVQCSTTKKQCLSIQKIDINGEENEENEKDE